MDGRELANDLAKHLELSGNMMAWTEVPLGESGYERADVIAVAKSFASKRFIIYEIKISRGDFLSDVNSAKYTKYKKHCNQLYFATPQGLIKKTEVPSDCGLITRSDKGWRVVKAAPRIEFKPTTNLMIRLLLRGYENHLTEYRKMENQRFKESKGLRDIARKSGNKIAYALANSMEYLDRAREMQRVYEEKLGRTFRDLGDCLFWLEKDIDKLIIKRKYTKEAIELSKMVMDIFDGRPLFLNGYADKLRNIANILDSGEDNNV